MLITQQMRLRVFPNSELQIIQLYGIMRKALFKIVITPDQSVINQLLKERVESQSIQFEKNYIFDLHISYC